MLEALNKILCFKHLTLLIANLKQDVIGSVIITITLIKYKTKVIYKIIIVNPTTKTNIVLYLYQLSGNIYHESEIKFLSHNKGCYTEG